MEKSFLKFSENGTSFVINLANGSETMEITSKEEGFKAIVTLIGDKKITPKEFSEMRGQILGAEKLPLGGPKNVSISIAIVGDDFLTGKGPLTIGDIMARPEKPVKVAYFKVCESCGKHGRIYTKTSFTSEITSQKEAIFYIEVLKKRKNVTDEEFQKVKTEIEASTLPKK